ncbi:ataxin-2 isoform X3 [Carcharodon carcharias]|uniref:ataxin-2 isoform X3 n=1 Tax=Carcharodon carcharias TaxID=13397 RepID=UPI001B7DE343|nr:ataxin-2 isoform X3 [Carcharodon carcharias]
MSMKQPNSRKPSGGIGAGGAGGGGGGGGRQSGGRGRSSGKGPLQSTIPYDGIYANMRMVHILTSVVGAKCELKVKNGGIYEGVFKTYSPKCDLVLDAAHRKNTESSSRELGPKREDIVESIIFKSADVVMLHFKDVDLSYARRVPSETDAFTDAAIGSRLNGEHKDKDLEPWDGGDGTNEDLEALESDVSNGWDPNDMFRFNEETYGVRSTYDSSLSSYTVPLERDNSEEFLRREARAAQLAEEIESSAQYKARVALENDERTEEEKYTAVQRSPNERESHGVSPRENKYIPPGQRNRDAMSWGSTRQHSPRIGQTGSGPPPSRAGSHTPDYSPNSGTDQRVVNGGVAWPSPCPSPSSRPPSRYPSAPNSLPPRAATPTRPPSRPPSRPSRPPSHPSAHGSPAPVSTMPKRMSSEGPPRMSPKAQRHPRHRGPSGRTGMSSGSDFISHSVSGEISTPVPRNNPSGGTWSSVVSGGSSSRLSPKTHRPRSPRHGNQPSQYNPGNASSGMIISSPQPGSVPAEPLTMPATAVSPTPASPTANRAVTPSSEAKESRLQEQKQNSPSVNKEIPKPTEICNTPPILTKPGIKATSPMASDHKKQIADLKKFREDFRTTSTPDPVVDQFSKSREGIDNQPRDPIKEKITVVEPGSKESVSESSSNANTSNGSSKPSSPSTSPNINSSEQKRGPDMTSQAVQTTGPSSKPEKEDKEDKKEGTPEQVRKSTLNPNAKEFNPKAFYTPPKPTTTPTPPRPQAQPSPSIVVQQHPPTVYNQPMCFAQNMVYPVPVSPGVQTTHMYHVPMTPMPINQAKSYRAGKVPTMPQQRPDQHHPQGTPTIMHPVSAAGQIVSTAPAYSQYVTYNPQQFANQPLVQSVAHYQSQPQMYSQVMQSNARMMAPPGHGQPGMVPSSTAQYPTAEQTHAMYVSPGPIHQQFAPHPTATLHPHPPHPQPSATPTGQQQGQHAGSHPAQSPVQHPQHQAPQTLHLGNPQQQQAIYHTTLTPTPPSMTQGPSPQSPQTSFPSAQQTVYTLHPQQVQHGYSNPPHMTHVPQAHVQSGMGPPHHPAATHPPMMLMSAQPPGGQGAIPQSALPPIPVSSTTHFSYMAHPQVQAHHQQQL